MVLKRVENFDLGRILLLMTKSELEHLFFMSKLEEDYLKILWNFLVCFYAKIAEQKTAHLKNADNCNLDDHQELISS